MYIITRINPKIVNIEFVANSTLLDASIPNHIEFVANSTLLGANCHQSDELIQELLNAWRPKTQKR